MTRDEALAWLRAAAEERQVGSVAPSAEAISSVAAGFPDDLTIQHFAGIACRVAGNFDAAVQHFNKALSIRPRFNFTEAEMAHLHWARGEMLSQGVV